jgi:hypothetical protein
MLKKTTIYHRINGSKQRILDLSEFPDEADMDISKWYEAWNRFSAFIEKHADNNVKERWRRHFEFLKGQDEFENNFQAILRFDIEERTRYFTSPHSVDPTDYARRFAQLQLQVIQEQVNKAQALATTFKTSPSSEKFTNSSRRFTPYVREKTFTSGSNTESSSKPFRPAPLCFICKREHKVSACSETTTAEGKQTFAKRVDRQMVKRDGGTPICFFFNAYSNKRCERSHADLHVCSFCGSTDHGACTRKCL